MGYANSEAVEKRDCPVVGRRLYDAPVCRVRHTVRIRPALGQAHANRDKAAANMELARLTFNRYQGLLTAGAISRQTYDQEKSAYDQAVAAYNQTTQAVSQAESGLLQTDVDKANETALLRRKEQAEAALRQIEVNLDETIIRAPFDGIITEKYVEEGSMISTGTPLVAVEGDR